MKKLVTPLVVLVALLGGAMFLAHAGDKKEERRARRQREKLEDLSKKLSRRLALPGPSEENVFLHERASALLERTKQSGSDSYVFDRLAKATDALLEASEEIFESREPDDDKDREDRREAALKLQRCYFRVQQSEYFARLSGERDAELYVKHCRSLYQQARGAYDSKAYRKAEKLGEASVEIVRALEYLAQASVRIPEPPPLQ